MKATICKSIILFFCFFLLLSVFDFLAAAPSHDDDYAPSLNDTDKLSAFMDGLIEAYMEEHKAAGAVVSIIRDGELLYQQGYGHANIAEGIPVAPETTLFRIGSISKLFTWLAVLQQVERGRLDLDADINKYLTAFSIPETYDEPVTLRSLMSHTPGFEDIWLRLFMREEDSVPTLEEIFKDQMPKRIMPPLQEAAYSNHGTGLAQYLVEQASGMPFETYVEEHIFGPLGMHYSTFRQPVPEHLRAHMPVGYAYRNGRFEEQHFEIIPMAGAGGASTTASDMAVFMDALLNHTRKDTISLMDSATYAIMKEPALVHANRMNPALHGFMNISPNHIKIIGHGGNTFLFHSGLALFPEHNTGLFISFNGESAGLAYSNVLDHFVRRYFPNTDPPPAFIELEEDYLQGFAGQYIVNRRPHSDILKIIGLMSTIQVSAEDGKLLFKDFFGDAHLMAAVDSTTFYVEKDNSFIGFYRPPGEKAQKLFKSNYPIQAADRVSGTYKTGYHLAIFILTMICIIYILAIWPWLYFARKHYEKKPRKRKPLPLFSQAIAWVVALFLAVFYALVFFSAGGTEIVYGIPTGIRIGLFFPIAAIPFILLMIFNSIYLWRTPSIKKLSRLFYGFATLVFLLCLWQLHFFNMLGWKF